MEDKLTQGVNKYTTSGMSTEECVIALEAHKASKLCRSCFPR